MEIIKTIEARGAAGVQHDPPFPWYISFVFEKRRGVTVTA
jgi:hypothetical protein